MQPHYIAIAIGLIGALAMIPEAHANKVSTEGFVRQASIAGKFEIESSRLALEKSQNDDVKAFAREMIDDHSKASEELKDALESSRSQAEPAETLDRGHQQLLDKLESASDTGFDRQYIDIQTNAHKKAVALFSNYAKRGADRSLKTFAANTLPTLQEHLQHVKELQTSR